MVGSPLIPPKAGIQLTMLEIHSSHRTRGELHFYDENDLNTHIDYVHYNPVKHGSVKDASAWPGGINHLNDAAVGSKAISSYNFWRLGYQGMHQSNKYERI